MSDPDLIDAVAQKTGEDFREIRRRGFTLTGPDDAGMKPEYLGATLHRLITPRPASSPARRPPRRLP